MSKSAMIRARTTPELKKNVEPIFKELGLTTTEAINLFYRQVCLYRGLPFDVRIPNEETLKTFNESDKGENLKECKIALKYLLT